MDVSAAFPPGPKTPDHIAIAEGLGFRRAWVYDSPALYSDVWVTLGRAADRPIEVPILIAGEGPKGIGVARELGDGIFSVTGPKEGFNWCAVLQFGTVLGEGETFDSPRVIECAGHAAGAMYHGILEWSGP